MPYLKNQRVLKNSAPKNLFRMVKNGYSKSLYIFICIQPPGIWDLLKTTLYIISPEADYLKIFWGVEYVYWGTKYILSISH